MQIVLNQCHGGFGLSDRAVEACLARGMSLTTYTPDGEYADPNADFVKLDFIEFIEFDPAEYNYQPVNEDSVDFRTNPVLVDVVREMGFEANGRFAKLDVMDVNPEGCSIHNSNGVETVR